MDLSAMKVFGGIPANIALSIFLAGLFLGFMAASLLFLSASPSGAKRSREGETPHDIIMAIKRRAGEGRGSFSFFRFVGVILFIVFVLFAIFVIVAGGRYWLEGKPAGEEFIPYVLRAFVFPLQERFPFLFSQ